LVWWKPAGRKKKKKNKQEKKGLGNNPQRGGRKRGFPLVYQGGGKETSQAETYNGSSPREKEEMGGSQRCLPGGGGKGNNFNHTGKNWGEKKPVRPGKFRDFGEKKPGGDEKRQVNAFKAQDMVQRKREKEKKGVGGLGGRGEKKIAEKKGPGERISAF